MEYSILSGNEVGLVMFCPKSTICYAGNSNSFSNNMNEFETMIMAKFNRQEGKSENISSYNNTHMLRWGGLRLPGEVSVEDEQRTRSILVGLVDQKRCTQTALATRSGVTPGELNSVVYLPSHAPLTSSLQVCSIV